MTYPHSKLLRKAFAAISPVVCALLAAACHSGPAATTHADETKDSVDAFVFAGELTKADSALNASLRNAPDSDSFYEDLGIGTSLDYYNARLDSLDSKVERISAYVAAAGESERRNEMMFNAMQAKAASFVQYRFNPDSSVFFMKRAIHFAHRIDNKKRLLMAYSNLADALKNMGSFDKSMEYYMRAASLADSIDADPESRLPVYMGIASDFTGLRDFDNSKIWWDKTLELKDAMSFNDIFQYHNNRGNDYYYRKDYENALRIYLELDSILGDKPEYEWERHFCHANLSDVYLKLGMPEKAEPYIDENLRYFTETQPNDYAATHVRTQKTEWLTATGRIREARELAESFPLSPDTRPEQLSLRLDLEKRLYSSLGDWEKAFKAQHDYQALEDSIRNSQVKMNIATIRHQYEHDAQMKDLRNEADEKNRKLLYSHTIIALAVVLLALLTAVIILSKRMAKDREERMIRKILDLRMKGLRNRLTPHFIYNILNNELGDLHDSGKSNISRLVHLLRQQQVMADRLTDTLHEELDFVDNYVALRSETQPGEVLYEKHIADDIDPEKVTLPSMSLQIFVENAFKHGFSTLPPEAERILIIKVYVLDGEIHMEVCNNEGPAGKPESESTRQGIRIISGTLEILNEKKDRQIRFNLDKWTDNPQHAGRKASLTIPCGFIYPPR